MKIAITGGIGAGKSYVCRRLEKRGISIYDCDSAAKRLIRTSPDIQSALRHLVGDEVFHEKVLQKQLLARFVTSSEANANAVNDIIHPAVAHDFEASGMQWLESAIFFDSGFDKRVAIDKVICVSAPERIRIQRVMERDHINEERVLAWIRRQMSQEDVIKRSDFVIVNDGIQDIEEQIDIIIKQIRQQV